MILDRKRATLILADGTVYTGYSFGSEGTVLGEVVFTTGMVGYQETLTDPSFYGQLVVQTFPLMGNYGVNDEDFESDRVHLRGYIVREWCELPSNFRSNATLDEYLKSNRVVGICGLDTRALTRKLREVGVMNGMITTEPVQGDLDALLEQIQAHVIRDAVQAVSVQHRESHPSENPRHTVALYDFGHKYSIRRWLNQRDCTVVVVPPNTSAAEIVEMGVDGVMLSNGPGDPADNPAIIENLRRLSKTGIPIFGICLGHQLMALAQGARTEKMRYGHRGGNQPVTDLDLGRTFITSQNHGYAVLGETLPAEVGYVSHQNANDKTCEGVRYTAFPCFTVQFHPEACSGPRDTNHLFDEFVALMDKHKEETTCR